MKILATILLVSLLTINQSLKAQAQFGVKAGLNYVNNETKDVPAGVGMPSDYRFGYHAGLYSSIGLTNKFSLRPELLFSNKGTDFGGKDNQVLHLNYINLPVLASYHICKSFTIMAGPELGYLLSAKVKSDSETRDVRSFHKNEFDLGLSLGLGYAFAEKLMVEVRYTRGFSSTIGDVDVALTDENGAPIGTASPESQNRTLQLSVAYRLK